MLTLAEKAKCAQGLRQGIQELVYRTRTVTRNSSIGGLFVCAGRLNVHAGGA